MLTYADAWQVKREMKKYISLQAYRDELEPKKKGKTEPHERENKHTRFLKEPGAWRLCFFTSDTVLNLLRVTTP
jgi:hypothetical protein